MPASPIPLTDNDVDELFQADSALYPSPLSVETLASWVAAAPALSFVYPSGGILVALPIIAPHWCRLVTGELKEWDIDIKMICCEPGAAVGIHVYHIERHDGWPKEQGPFAEPSLRELRSRVQAHQLNVVGWSALVVTAEGQKCFERFGLMEKAYAGQVVIQTAGNGTCIVEKGMEEKDAMVVAECKMLFDERAEL